MQPDPGHVPEGARAVVLAFPQRLAGGRLTHTYDLWIVDAAAWTGRLTQWDAIERLVAEGYLASRARGKLRQARDKAANRYLDAGQSTCPICSRVWTVTPRADCSLPTCGCYGHDTSAANPARPCEPCGISHALRCERMPSKLAARRDDQDAER